MKIKTLSGLFLLVSGLVLWSAPASAQSSCVAASTGVSAGMFDDGDGTAPFPAGTLNWVVDMVITNVELPREEVAHPAIGQLTFELLGAPTGISVAGPVDFDSFPTVSGTPGNSGSFSMTFRMRDDDGCLERVIAAVVTGPTVPLTFTPTSLDAFAFTYTAGVDIGSPLTLPTVSGGDETYTLSLDSGPAPTGLSFDDSTNPATLSGMPADAAAGDYSLTFSATDGASGYGSLTFGMHVAALGSCVRGTSVISFDTGFQKFPDPGLYWVVDTDIEDTRLPPEPGTGSAVVADPNRNDIGYYDLLGAPDGISLNGIEQGDGGAVFGLPHLTGRPTALGTYSMTFRVRDDLGCIEEVIEAVVHEPTTPLAFDPTVLDGLSYTAGVDIGSLTLPEVSGGDGTYTLTFDSGPVPTGLSFDGSTNPPTLSGMPANTAAGQFNSRVPAGSYSLTFSATDGALPASTGSLTFGMHIAPGSCVLGTTRIAFNTSNTARMFPAGPYSWVANTPIGRVLLPNEDQSNARAPVVADRVRQSVFPYYELLGIPPGITFLGDAVRGATIETNIFGEPELRGTPTTPGAYSMTYRIRDDVGCIEQVIAAEVSTGTFALAAQGNLTFTFGLMVDQALSEVSGGVPDYSFSLSDADGGLPPGLSFAESANGLSLTLSGVPTTEKEHVMAYTVSDSSAAGTPATANFNISIIAPPLVFDPSSQDNQTYARSELITELSLPTAMGGTPASAPPEYNYTLSGLPAGLSFDDTPPSVTGTPTADLGDYPVTFTVTDSAATPVAAELLFTFTLVDGLAFSSTVAAQTTYTATATITDLVLPTGVGGIGSYAYTLTGTQPNGLTFDSGTATSPPSITGTPDTAAAATMLTFTVTSGTDTETQTFSITVVAAPAFASSQADLTFTQDRPFTAVSLPLLGTGTEGHGQISYKLGPTAAGEGALPAGLSFLSGELSGLPTAANAPGGVDLTYRATDENDAFVESVFNVIIYAPLALDPAAVAEQSYTAEREIGTLSLPTATGGDSAYIYTLTGTLNGLEFNVNDSNATNPPTLSGTPAAAAATTTLVYMVADGTGDTLDLDILVTVAPAVQFTATQDNVALVKNDSVAILFPRFIKLPAAGVGQGTGSLTYTLGLDAGATGALPNGLFFNSSSREISGTPIENTDPAGVDLTYRVTDTNGAFDEQVFKVLIIDAIPPPLAVALVAEQTYFTGAPITPLTLPAATGGLAPYIYTIGGTLNGLTFDSSATPPTLSGMPAVVASNTLNYTVTDTFFEDTANVAFNVLVLAGLSFEATVTAQTFSGGDIVDLTLPTVSGGTPNINPPSYKLTLDGAPGELAFDAFANPATLSGALSFNNSGDYSLTFTATDSYGLTPLSVSLTFAVSVTATPASTSQPYFDLGRPLICVSLDGSASARFDIPNAAVRYQFQLGTDAVCDLPYIIGGTGATGLKQLVTPDANPLPFSISGTNGNTKIQYDKNGPDDTDTPVAFSRTTGIAYAHADDNSVLAQVRGVAEQTFLNVYVVVKDVPLMLTETVSNIIAKVDAPLTTAAALPAVAAASNGAAPYTYTLTGLPNGLTFDPTARALSGTPLPSGEGVHNVVLVVSDSTTDPNGGPRSSAPQTFTITVEAATASLTQAALTFTARYPVQDQTPLRVELAEVSAGVGDYVYSVDSSLPDGVSFAPGTRTLSGTPAVAAVGSFDVVYSAAGTDDPSTTFTLVVDPEIVFNAATANFAEEAVISADGVSALDPPLTLPTASGGRGIDTYDAADYELTPDITDAANDFESLAFDAASRVISGTLTDSGGELTWIATDANGAKKEFRFTITTTGPVFIATTQDDLTFEKGVSASVELPEPNTNRAKGAVVYKLEDENGVAINAGNTVLPGLAFNANSRVLSGTPTAGRDPVALVYTATDSEGSSTSLRFSVSIDPTLLTFDGNVSPNQTFTVGDDIEVYLPKEEFGTGIGPYYTFTLTGQPNSLAFNKNTRFLSGIFTQGDIAASPYTLSYTVTDSATPAAYASQTFTFTVEAQALVFDSAIADKVYSVGDDVNEELPAATGGKEPITYRLDGLPAGSLVFDSATRDFYSSDTLLLDDTSDGIEVTFTATDDETPPEVVSQTFTITIDNPPLALAKPTNVLAACGVDIGYVRLPSPTGGSGSYTHDTPTVGGLPSGLTSTTVRSIEGTPEPSTAGSYILTFKVSDNTGTETSQTFNLEVADCPDANTEAYLLVPGTGEKTRPDYDAFEQNVCAGISSCDVRAYLWEDGAGTPSNCQDSPAKLEVGNADTSCVMNPALDSFTSEVLFIATGGGSERRQVRKVYVAPSVGFDVGVAQLEVSAAEAESGAIALTFEIPVSLASTMSGQAAPKIVVGRSLSGTDTTFSPLTFESGAHNITGGTPGTLMFELTFATVDTTATLSLLSAGDFTFSEQTFDEALPTGADSSKLDETDLTGSELFALGNARVALSAVRRPSNEIVFDFDSAGSREAPTTIPETTGTLQFSVTTEGADANTVFEINIILHDAGNAYAARTLDTITRAAGVAYTFAANTPFTDADGNSVTPAGRDTLEFRAKGAGGEGRFLVRVVGSGADADDADGDGVPTNEDDDDTATNNDIVQVYAQDEDGDRTTLTLPELKVTGGSTDINLALGAYALAAAQLEGADQTYDYSALVYNREILNRLDRGPDVNEALGVFDYAVSNIGLRETVSVFIELVKETDTAASVYKWTEDDGWSPFNKTDTDRVYSAPAPCPGIGASRGTSEEDAWQESDTNTVPANTQCLLVQIQDGGANDGDGTVNGVIHDPIGLVQGFSVKGGGATTPLWLLLLAPLTRRRRS